MNRNQSLDALRGFAILTMVLSGSIAFGGVLPPWMYHAQVPPPHHKFIPTIPGITWVDLVFPFFLFSMGAAIPLSLSRSEEGLSFLKVLWIGGRRFLLLTFFALFTFHMRAWVISENPGPITYLYSVAAFILLFFQFYDDKGTKYKTLFSALKISSFAIAALMLYLLPFNKGKGFQLDKVDIIILVLGNMAFFGTLVWWMTRRRKELRLALLLFVMAVFLGSKEKETWNEAFFNFSPLPWMYKFYYLKYLFIILPGTLAGEWILESTKRPEASVISRPIQMVITLLSFILIWCNVALLFTRLLVLNLALSLTLCLAIFYSVKKASFQNHLLKQFCVAGSFLLLLGLFFEGYEGGIKKDPSTYSYYFVTSGLAFFMLIGLNGLAGIKIGKSFIQYLALNGKNPMVAYVAGNLLLIPILHLTGAIAVFNSMNTNPWIGFLRGVLFTGIVSLITIGFTKRKWFWKT